MDLVAELQLNTRIRVGDLFTALHNHQLWKPLPSSGKQRRLDTD